MLIDLVFFEVKYCVQSKAYIGGIKVITVGSTNANKNSFNIQVLAYWNAFLIPQNYFPFPSNLFCLF